MEDGSALASTATSRSRAASGTWPSSVGRPAARSAAWTAGRSMASRMTACAIARSPPQAGLLPSTMTSLRSSSTPAEVLARPESSDQSAPIAASGTPSSSPSASATPSAEAPRDRPMEW